MKKIVVLIVIISVILALAACEKKPENTPENPDWLSEHAYLGKFTNEDGSGEIYIGMPEEDFVEFLKKHNIPFETHGYGTSLDYNIDGIRIRYGIDDGKLSGIELQETAKGLCVGDSVEKMKRLYGNNYVYDDSDEPCYTYTWQNGAVLLISVGGPEGDQTVTSMGMGIQDPESEE